VISFISNMTLLSVNGYGNGSSIYRTQNRKTGKAAWVISL
jgi:hypothetical protein